MKKIISIIAAIAAFIPAAAQQTKGKVVDADGAPVEFVNVIAKIKADSSIVTGAVTGEDGTFAVELNGKKAGVLEFNPHCSQSLS